MNALEQARQLSDIRIACKNEQTFAPKPQTPNKTPFNVDSVDLGISAEEIIGFILEGRKAS